VKNIFLLCVILIHDTKKIPPTFFPTKNKKMHQWLFPL
jgi:hypothetical protein